MALGKIVQNMTGAAAAAVINGNDVDLQYASENKIDKVYSANLLNPATFQYGKFYYQGQSGVIASGTNLFGTSGFIPANPAGLITSGAGLTSQGLSSYAVFNKEKVWLRNGQNSNQYTYVAGDGFVCFIYNQSENSTSWASNKAVNVGTTYSLVPFSDYVPLTLLEKRVTTLETVGYELEDITNGQAAVYADVTSMGTSTPSAIPERNIAQDYFVFRHSGAGNLWAVSPVFVPTGSRLVRIKGNVQFTRSGGATAGINFVVAKSPNAVAGTYFTIGATVRDNGNFEITFDPAYYNVYQGFTDFYVWINNESGMSAGQVMDAKITGFKVFEMIGALNTVNISGDNAKQLFATTDASITEIKSKLSAEQILIASDGSKFLLSVNNAGAIVAIPIIPTKGAFIGNSLLAGFGYGMAASEAQFDYYNRINNFIITKRPTYTYTTVTNGGLESAETEAQLVAAINTIVAALSGTETLVSVQLGDNVNTPAKEAIFNGGGCLRTLQAIRNKCPNARVVFMGIWYGNTAKYNTIINACAATGCKFITYADLISSATVSHVGAITKKGTATRTLSGVTGVVANTPTNITVSFISGSVAYTSTLDVTSYSVTSGVLTYTGLYEIISNTGVASHPSDEGFRLIANRFLYQMGITDNPVTYLT